MFLKYKDKSEQQMEINRWQELTKVLECGSLTAAAEELGYTLSGISRNMAALEKETGMQLLIRKKTGVTPTAECEALMPYIQKIIFDEECLKQKTAELTEGNQGLIRIGTAYRHYYRWITEVTSDFHEEHPGVQFRIFHGTSTEFVQKLHEHQLDFGLISEREGEHVWYPLCTDELVALIPKQHPLAATDTIPAKAFETEAYIATCPNQDIDSGRYLAECGVKPNTQFTTMDIQATYAMVDAGLGISMTNQINRVAGYPGVRHLPLEIRKEITIGLACGKERTPAAEVFRRYVLSRLPNGK